MISGAQANPNISKHSNIVATGHLVAEQNNTAIPIAAPVEIGNAKTVANVPPKVAPINNVGMISPPL